MDTEQKLRRLLTDAAGSLPAAPASPSRQSRDPLYRRFGVSWRVFAWSAVVVVVVTAIGIGLSHSRSGNGSSSSSAARSGTAGSTSSRQLAAPAAGADTSAGTGSGSKSAAAAPGAGTSGVSVRNARVVQTGQLAIRVRPGGVRNALNRLEAIAAGAGGYVGESRSQEGPNGSEPPSGSTSLRVPVDHFTAVLGQARALGTVLSSSSNARDVTGQYVDLTARISALSDTRATYLTLLSRAGTIGDTLAVQQQIQQVQSQLEQLQGQQKVLADSSDLATLTVSVTQSGQPATPTSHHATSGFAKALRSAGHNFNVGLQAVITVAGPLLLALLVLAFVAGVVLAGRRAWRHYTRPAA